MRILSWNVNGIRAVEKKGFVSWMETEGADVVCIQETKARPEQLSPELLEIRDKNGEPYHAYWASAKKAGYSGVAIYSKTEPLDIKTLGIGEFDDEGRVLEADYRDFTLISAYFPNSQDAGKRLDYKLAFCDAILKLCETYRKKKRHFVLAGDYNIAHTEIDLARPKENEGNAGYLPEERAWMDAFTGANGVGDGFVDTFRHFHPGEKGHYSWWSYRMNARERNVGWRIDYHCIDPEFLPFVESSIIRPEVQGSDHCPVELTLKKMKIRYNAPTVLTFALISAAVLILSQTVARSLTLQWFAVPGKAGFNAGSLRCWVTLFTHVLGHKDWPHLISNFTFILLIGPILEELYGSLSLVIMICITAFVTGALNVLFFSTGLLGASGVVFMMVLLVSFTNFNKGEIPLTFILVMILYLGKELFDSFRGLFGTGDDISQFGHIVGGFIGSLFGFLRAPRRGQ